MTTDKTDNLRDPRLIAAARELLQLADQIDPDDSMALAAIALADAITERNERKRREQR